MAAPTYAQIMAELADWEANPNKRYITGPRLISLMKQYLNHLTNNGAYDPGTFMQQVVGVIGTYPDRFSSLSTVLYVNQATGNDSNTGTQALPLKTIQRAAEITRNKFVNVEIRLVGDYDLAAYAHFIVNQLVIYIEDGKTFTFKSFQLGGLGYATYPIIFEGSQFAIRGESNSKVTVESHSGPASGFENNYYYHVEQGALRCGNAGIQYLKVNVSVLNIGTITIGNNTTFITGREGNSSLFSRPFIYFEHNRVTTWTLGTKANINLTCRKGYFRKSILFNAANTWKTLAEGGELNLLTGAYAVRVDYNSGNGGGVAYTATFSGIMSWYGETTNDGQNEPREVMLHGNGNDLNGKSLKLRTVTTGILSRLEVALDETLSSAILVELYFSKLD